MRFKYYMPPLPSLFLKTALWTASFLGSGYSPKAPGTAGTAAAMIPPVVVAFSAPKIFVTAFSGWIFWAWFLPAWGIAHVSVRAVLYAAPPDQQDPGFIVIDEALGIWLTLHLPCLFFTILRSAEEVAAVSTENVLLFLTGAFVLFRLFDITKPFPVSWCDKHIKGAAGVILDDLVAGLLAGLLLTTGVWLITT